jgi:hypothetical protein
MSDPENYEANCRWILYVAGLLLVVAVTMITIEASSRIVGGP